MVYQLFKYSFMSGELGLGEQPLLKRDEAIEKVVYEDFMRERRFNFADATGKREYVHEYMWTQDNTVTVFKLGYLRDVKTQFPQWNLGVHTDFPHGTVILSLQPSSPYMAVAKFEEAYRSAKEVAQLMEKGLNSSLAGRGLAVRITPCDDDKDAEEWGEVMYGIYQKAKQYKEETLNSLANYKKRKLNRGIRPKIGNLEKADEILTLLHQYINGKTTPKDIMRPIRAAYYAGAIGHITLSAFKEEFGDILGKSSSAIGKYLAKDCKSYNDDPLYDEMLERFRRIVEK